LDFDRNFNFDLDFAYNLLVFNPILDSCLDVRLVSDEYLDLYSGSSPSWDLRVILT
jgi:hypothetical protein